MAMVIIFSTLGVEIYTCGHEIGTILAHFGVQVMSFCTCGHEIGTILAHFGVLGMSFDRRVLVFSRILLPIHKKIYTSGGLGPGASSCHLLHLFFSASPRAFQESQGLSVCEWPVWLFATQSMVNTEGCWLHATPVEGNICQYICWAPKFFLFFMYTHRLVPFTRYYVLVCGR